MMKRCDKILRGYEEKLHLIDKFLKTKEKVAAINRLANEMKNVDTSRQQKYLDEIEQVSRGILEDF